MSAEEPQELGMLIVVVGKARNLVNKSRFGKQDPFCTVSWGEDKQKTKAIKRGGQHPEWDEELRFTIMEDTEDVLARSQSVSDSLASSTSVSSLGRTDSPGVTTAQALAAKSRKGLLGKKGQKAFKLACYADDAKEPEMIGECSVAIEDVLKKGEVDEWYDIMYKEKYSGEVYLELTFYSNDAPPIKRNVPRPSVSNYGGAGVFDAGPSSSPSHHRLTGSISASGSVSGMSLYIPPYAKPDDIAPPPMNHSSSFGNLGVPPIQRQSTPLPGQPAYPPSLTPAPQQNLGIDALTRPMSSMSLASNISAGRPLPPSTPTPSQSYGHHQPHRHSLGGPNDAPWGSLLPQSQPPPALAPHPRPMSSNDAVPWDHAQRLEEERRRAGATPVPRPVSGQGYQAQWQGQADPYRGATPVPGSLPSSLQVAGPPVPVKHHANSFSGSTGAPNLPIHGYGSTTPEPIPHPNSAPPTSPTNHYGVPASSFGGLAQNLMDQGRPPSAQPQGYGYQQDPYQNGNYQPTPPRQEYPAQPTYGTPLRQESYPPRNPLPDPNGYQSPPLPTPPRESSYPPGQAYHNNHGQQQPPPQQPLPTANSGGYVPWYQQTQAPAPPPQQYPPPSTPLPETYPPTSSYGSPPPVSQYRPVPNPPAPPKSAVGYYPSDELYANQPPPRSQPSPNPPWQPTQSSYDPPYSGPSQLYQSPHTPTPYTHNARHSYSGSTSSTPAPPPEHRNSLGWQQPLPQIPPQQPPQSHGYTRSPSPIPPSQSGYRAPSPIPSPIPPSQSGYRAPSPIPPPQTNPTQGYYNPPPPVQGYRSPSPQPYTASPSALVPPQPNGSSTSRTPSPNPNARQDWKSYMQNLSVESSPVNANGYGQSPALPPRAPSPQPPPKDWYTPPPSLPASIRPPDGWRSTLPTDGSQQHQQQWR